MRKNRFSYEFIQSKKKTVLWSGIGIILIGIFTFFMAFKVKKVEILGNNRYPEKEIKEYIMVDPLVGNTILAQIFRKKIETEDLPFVESFTLEKLDNHTLRIHVNEKQMVGYVVQGREKLYLDKDGVVLEQVVITEQDMQTLQPETTESDVIHRVEFHAAVKDVPQVIGLDKSNLSKGDKMHVQDEHIFNTLLGITRIVEKYEIRPEAVVIAKDGMITLVYNNGNIHCRLGKDYLLEEKITRVASILPKLETETGILHLEDYQTDTVNIIFSKENKEELQQYIKAVEYQNGQSKEEADQEKNTKKNEKEKEPEELSDDDKEMSSEKKITEPEKGLEKEPEKESDENQKESDTSVKSSEKEKNEKDTKVTDRETKEKEVGDSENGKQSLQDTDKNKGKN